MVCPQELCVNWTGQGCVCAVLDLPRPETDDEEAEEMTSQKTTCSYCAEDAVLTIEAEEAPDEPMHGCVVHAGAIALVVVDMYIEEGVVCVYRANES